MTMTRPIITASRRGARSRLGLYHRVRLASSSSASSPPGDINVPTDGAPENLDLGGVSYDIKISSSRLHAVLLDLHVMTNDGAELGFGNTWNLRQSAGALCTYLDTRGIRRGLFTRFPYLSGSGSSGSSSSSTGSDIDTDMMVSTSVSRFVEMLSVDGEFTFTAKNAGSPAEVPARLKEALAGLQVEPRNTLVLSNDPGLLRCAKDSECFTASIKDGGKFWKANQISTYKVPGLSEVQEAVEDLNGITYRSSML